jgi:hypothetical protein
MLIFTVVLLKVLHSDKLYSVLYYRSLVRGLWKLLLLIPGINIYVSVLFGRVSCSSSGDRRVPWLRKSSMVWIWQRDKRTNDYKIILNLCKKINENKSEKEAQYVRKKFRETSKLIQSYTCPFCGHLWIKLHRLKNISK